MEIVCRIGRGRGIRKGLGSRREVASDPVMHRGRHTTRAWLPFFLTISNVSQLAQCFCAQLLYAGRVETGPEAHALSCPSSLIHAEVVLYRVPAGRSRAERGGS